MDEGLYQLFGLEMKDPGISEGFCSQLGNTSIGVEAQETHVLYMDLAVHRSQPTSFQRLTFHVGGILDRAEHQFHLAGTYAHQFVAALEAPKLGVEHRERRKRIAQFLDNRWPRRENFQHRQGRRKEVLANSRRSSTMIEMERGNGAR